MSKTSQRRTARAAKRYREKGMSPSEVQKVLLIGHRFGQPEKTPVEFWDLLGHSQKADPPHPDDCRISEALDRHRRWLEVLGRNFDAVASDRQQDHVIVGGLPGDLSCSIGGLLIIDAGSPSRVQLLCSTLAGRGVTCCDDFLKLIRAYIKTPESKPADVAIWAFTLDGPGNPLFCVGCTPSGAFQCHTFVRGNWLRAASVAAVLDVVFSNGPYWKEARPVEEVATQVTLDAIRKFLAPDVPANVDQQIEDVLSESFDICRHGSAALSARLASAVAEGLEKLQAARAALVRREEEGRLQQRKAVRLVVEQVKRETSGMLERLQRQLAESRERETRLQRSLQDAAKATRLANEIPASSVAERLEAIFHV